MFMQCPPFLWTLVMLSIVSFLAWSERTDSNPRERSPSYKLLASKCAVREDHPERRPNMTLNISWDSKNRSKNQQDTQRHRTTEEMKQLHEITRKLGFPWVTSETSGQILREEQKAPTCGTVWNHLCQILIMWGQWGLGYGNSASWKSPHSS